uniref:Secreted protein n=1 Tax=Ixodes ricinus TaxID=34613 RepID=A0A6B0UQA6_IXORI
MSCSVSLTISCLRALTSSSSMVVLLSVDSLTWDPSPFFVIMLRLEKLRVASMVVKIAPLSLRRALNFFKQSTVSWRCRVEATRSRWQIQGCFKASAAVILLAGLTVSMLLMRFLASGVTVSHSGDG